MEFRDVVVKSELEEVRLQVACATRRLTLEAAHVRVKLTSINAVTSQEVEWEPGEVVAGGKLQGRLLAVTENRRPIPFEVLEQGLKLLV